MKTLEEHNKEKMQEYDLLGPEWRLIPIACVSCGAELQAQTSMILTSHPPKQKVRCSKPSCSEYNKVVYMII